MKEDEGMEGERERERMKEKENWRRKTMDTIKRARNVCMDISFEKQLFTLTLV